MKKLEENCIFLFFGKKIAPLEAKMMKNDKKMRKKRKKKRNHNDKQMIKK